MLLHPSLMGILPALMSCPSADASPLALLPPSQAVPLTHAFLSGRPSDPRLPPRPSLSPTPPSQAVPLTHANIAASLSNIAATYELSPSDRSYLVMPLFHVHGLMAGLLSPLASGAAVILPKEGKFAAGVFWKDCCEHGATFFTAGPTMHQVGGREGGYGSG